MPSRANCQHCRAADDSEAEPALSHHKDSVQQQQQLNESALNNSWCTVDRRKNRKATLSGSKPDQLMPDGHSQQKSLDSWSSTSEDLPLPGFCAVPDQVHSESCNLDHSWTVESNDDSTAATFNSDSIATKQVEWDKDTSIVADTWDSAEDAALSFSTEVEQCKWCSSVSHDSELCPQQTCEYCKQLGHHITRCRSRQQQAVLEPIPEPDYSDHVCHYCHHMGHIRHSCPKLQCFRCGQHGHSSYQCMRGREESQPASRSIPTTWDKSSSHTAVAPHLSRAAEATAAISSPRPPARQHSASSRPRHLSAPVGGHHSTLQHIVMAPHAISKLEAQPPNSSRAEDISEVVAGKDLGPSQAADDMLQLCQQESPAHETGSRGIIAKPAANAWVGRPGQQPAHIVEQPQGLTTFPEHAQAAHAQTSEEQGNIPGLEHSLENLTLAFPQQGSHAPVPQQAQAQPGFLAVPNQDKLRKQASEDGWDESKADAPFAPLPDPMSIAPAAPTPRFNPAPASCTPVQQTSPVKCLDDMSLPSQHSTWLDNACRSVPAPARTHNRGHPALPRCIIQPGMDVPQYPPPPAGLAPPGIRPGSQRGSRPNLHPAPLHKSMPYLQQGSWDSQLYPAVSAPSRRSGSPQPPRYDLQQQPAFDAAAPIRAYVQQEAQSAPAYIRPSASRHTQRSMHSSQQRLPSPINTWDSRQAFSSPRPAYAAVEAARHASRGLVESNLPGSPGRSSPLTILSCCIAQSVSYSSVCRATSKLHLSCWHKSASCPSGYANMSSSVLACVE